MDLTNKKNKTIFAIILVIVLIVIVFYLLKYLNFKKQQKDFVNRSYNSLISSGSTQEPLTRESLVQTSVNALESKKFENTENNQSGSKEEFFKRVEVEMGLSN